MAAKPRTVFRMINSPLINPASGKEDGPAWTIRVRRSFVVRNDMDETQVSNSAEAQQAQGEEGDGSRSESSPQVRLGSYERLRSGSSSRSECGIDGGDRWN